MIKNQQKKQSPPTQSELVALIRRFTKKPAFTKQVLEAYNPEEPPRPIPYPCQTLTTQDSSFDSQTSQQIRSRNSANSAMQSHRRQKSQQYEGKLLRESSFERRKAYDNLIQPILKTKLGKQKANLQLQKSAANLEDVNQTPFFDTKVTQNSPKSLISDNDEIFMSCKESSPALPKKQDTRTQRLNVPLLEQVVEDYRLCSKYLDDLLELNPSNEMKLSEKLAKLIESLN